jgi:Protein of unknown function (DUF2845)
MCTTNQVVSIVTRLPGVVGLNSGTAKKAPVSRNRGSSMGALTLAVFAFACIPGFASAGMRCGSRIIDRGTSSAEVSSFCGPPTQVDRTEAYRGRAATADSDSQPTGTVADVQIEFWTYNFGPNLLMERLRIEDGVVVEVQSLGYGFNEE